MVGRGLIVGVPRIIETSKCLFEDPRYSEAADQLDSQKDETEATMLKKRIEQEQDEVPFVNSYRNALNYMKENRLNMNFRQVDE